MCPRNEECDVGDIRELCCPVCVFSSVNFAGRKEGGVHDEMPVLSRVGRWSTYFTAYSPTSRFWGTANSCVGTFPPSPRSSKSSVGWFVYYTRSLVAFLDLYVVCGRDRTRTRAIFSGVCPAGPALRRMAFRRTVPVKGIRIILSLSMSTSACYDISVEGLLTHIQLVVRV